MVGLARKLWLAALVAMAAPAAGWAQEGKTTHIHVVFKSYYDRVRPGQLSGVTTEQLNITLSGKNNVREDIHSFNGKGEGSWSHDRNLGGGVWRVVASNKLEKVENLKQSVKTTVITTSGNSCTAEYTHKLLPGYSEYYIYSIVIKQYAYYSKAYMVSAECTIEG